MGSLFSEMLLGGLILMLSMSYWGSDELNCTCGRENEIDRPIFSFADPMLQVKVCSSLPAATQRSIQQQPEALTTEEQKNSGFASTRSESQWGSGATGWRPRLNELECCMMRVIIVTLLITDQLPSFDCERRSYSCSCVRSGNNLAFT